MKRLKISGKISFLEDVSEILSRYLWKGEKTKIGLWELADKVTNNQQNVIGSHLDESPAQQLKLARYYVEVDNQEKSLCGFIDPSLKNSGLYFHPETDKIGGLSNPSNFKFASAVDIMIGNCYTINSTSGQPADFRIRWVKNNRTIYFEYKRFTDDFWQIAKYITLPTTNNDAEYYLLYRYGYISNRFQFMYFEPDVRMTEDPWMISRGLLSSNAALTSRWGYTSFTQHYAYLSSGRFWWGNVSEVGDIVLGAEISTKTEFVRLPLDHDSTWNYNNYIEEDNNEKPFYSLREEATAPKLTKSKQIGGFSNQKLLEYNTITDYNGKTCYEGGYSLGEWVKNNNQIKKFSGQQKFIRVPYYTQKYYFKNTAPASGYNFVIQGNSQDYGIDYNRRSVYDISANITLLPNEEITENYFSYTNQQNAVAAFDQDGAYNDEGLWSIEGIRVKFEKNYQVYLGILPAGVISILPPGTTRKYVNKDRDIKSGEYVFSRYGAYELAPSEILYADEFERTFLENYMITNFNENIDTTICSTWHSTDCTNYSFNNMGRTYISFPACAIIMRG